MVTTSSAALIVTRHCSVPPKSSWQRNFTARPNPNGCTVLYPLFETDLCLFLCCHPIAGPFSTSPRSTYTYPSPCSDACVDNHDNPGRCTSGRSTAPFSFSLSFARPSAMLSTTKLSRPLLIVAFVLVRGLTTIFYDR